MDSRERFETWAISNLGGSNPASVTMKNGKYVLSKVEIAWQAWQAACPDGWQVVPKEPTQEMRQSKGMGALQELSMWESWDAMLTAAPKP